MLRQRASSAWASLAGMLLQQTIDALRVVIQDNVVEGDCREDGIVGGYDDPKP